MYIGGFWKEAELCINSVEINCEGGKGKVGLEIMVVVRKIKEHIITRCPYRAMSGRGLPTAAAAEQQAPGSFVQF